MNVIRKVLFVLASFIAGAGIMMAQNTFPLTGTVVDAQGSPVIGAGVVQTGTTNGTVTDDNGQFVIRVPENASVEVSALGYVPVTITAKNGETPEVVLQEDTKLLDEVVVIGYGTVKKSDLTGSLSQVSNKSFEDQKVTRVDQALQGRAAGVQVSNTVGAPGGDVRIRVRGANSVLGDNSPLFVVDGFVGVDFNSVNPNDIKSMEILKDASSTAIYGSRGANGVILITTKSGSKDGRVRVTYDGNVTVSKILKQYDLLSAGEYAETYNAHQTAFGLAPYFTDQQVKDYYANGGFDYVDAVLRTAVSHQHQISVDGGNQKTQWRVSGNYLDQQGIVNKSDYDRINVRASLNTKVNDRLSIRFNANTSTSNGYNNLGTSGANTILNQALAWAPTTDPYNEDGTYRTTDPTGSLKSNPLALLYDSEDVTEKTFITVLAGANYQIIPGLSIDFQAAMDQLFNKNKSWTGKDAAGSSGSSNASIVDSKGRTVQTTTQLSYVKDIKKHSINAVAAFETQSYKASSTTSTATSLTFPELKYNNLAQAAAFRTQSDYTMWSLVSCLARVNYSFDSRYLVSVSVRYDGSSKFSKDNRFSTFPAAALAWNIKKESFMRNVEPVSALKLRLSWGMTGSQAISPYATKSSFGNSSYSFNMDSSTNGIAVSDPANPDLKWETTDQKNIGLDLGFFNDRLTLEADYYIKDTKDLLLNKTVPSYQGGGSIVTNVGKIRNSGLDLTLTGKIIEKKDISLESTLNFSLLRNEVRDLGADNTVYLASNLTGINDGAYDFIYRVGEPLGTIYGLKYLGPWQKEDAALAAEYGCVPGDARYEDVDGNKIYDSTDYKIIGHGMPKHTLGWNTTFRYKKLSVNMFFQGVFGADKLNYNRCIYMSASRDVRGAVFSEVLDRYIPGVNENATLPAWSPTSTWYPVSSIWLENGSYFRMKNLSVAYDFSIRRFADFTVSFNTTNLFTITKYKGIDPEASNVGGGTSDLMQGLDYGAYPNSRSFTLGLNIRF
ncbi:MAG: SusC/RagA family TonB-linked outer membrane protein [Candidatus Cryptobacteroides sp.]